jgi:hypothetical protein
MVSLPSIVARGQQFGLNRQDQMIQMFSGTEVAIQNRPAFWSFNIPILPRSNADAKQWRATLAELSDRSKTFQATPPGYRGTAYSQSRIAPARPLLLSNGTNLELDDGELLEIEPGFTGGGELFVDGAGQLGTQVRLYGADPSELVFKAGEYFSVNGELKMVVANAFSNASGIVEVAFEPSFRQSPPDSEPVNIAQPTATFRLLDPVGGWKLQPNRLHSFTIQAVESYS